jgi:hypothetical protein
VTDPLADITAIVRERHQTGAYGDCHFRVAPDVLELMRQVPAAPKRHPWAAGALGSLLDIPVVNGEGLPAGAWQLVQWEYDRVPPFARTETVLKEGTVMA